MEKVSGWLIVSRTFELRQFFVDGFAGLSEAPRNHVFCLCG
jgi:hypothetical protein